MDIFENDWDTYRPRMLPNGGMIETFTKGYRAKQIIYSGPVVRDENGNFVSKGERLACSYFPIRPDGRVVSSGMQLVSIRPNASVVSSSPKLVSNG